MRRATSGWRRKAMRYKTVGGQRAAPTSSTTVAWRWKSGASELSNLGCTAASEPLCPRCPFCFLDGEAPRFSQAHRRAVDKIIRATTALDAPQDNVYWTHPQLISARIPPKRSPLPRGGTRAEYARPPDRVKIGSRLTNRSLTMMVAQVVLY